MKLKLFIITIIVASFATIGLLGGCGGGSNGNTEEPRDETIAVCNISPDTFYAYTEVEVDGYNDAKVYKDTEDHIVGLVIADNVGNNHTDKMYLLPSTPNIIMRLHDISNSTDIDFSATSSNDSIASVNCYAPTSHIVMLITPHAVGTTRINIGNL